MNSMREATSGVRTVVGLQTEQERNESCFPDMSFQTRMYGCLLCFITGTVLSILSTLMIWTGNYIGFAIIYTIGNVLAIFGSMFMVGPKRQCRLMWKESRAAATFIYLLAMACTLVIAFLVHNPTIPCLILILIQMAAATWYTLSFIPFARQTIRSALGLGGGSGSVGGINV
eukprot:CAMPEP_0171497326 /NCGR_PEP_ID=MMETSP0958-20121227/7213_1 /TAXON_ID=87120 /ORGANISM="Aurantiochytrium limacinum, Strain ATCCMYA-1381" /LENGTH=171 /DNA_ID=CAMNT_0012031563 /DNA_START=376 /DNA_END=891 /DNA_ORIENTATION=+